MDNVWPYARGPVNVASGIGMAKAEPTRVTGFLPSKLFRKIGLHTISEAN